MALSVASLKSRLISKINATIKPRYINIADDHTLSGYDYDTYTDDYMQVLAEAIVEEIQANARAQGLDSGGDNNDLPIV